MTHDIDWSKSTCGVMLCTFKEAIKIMPEASPVLEELLNSGTLEFSEEEYLVDIKVHMLMPKQYPCIPNWHRDFMPRDKNGNRIKGGSTGKKMFMWISGGPYTEYLDEFQNSVFKLPQKWHSFTQDDLHRGNMAFEHTWRCFIRVIPKEFKHGSTINFGKPRIHTQVYLDAEKFSW